MNILKLSKMEAWLDKVEALVLKDKNNYFNPYLGVPSYGHGVDSLYRQGLTPKEAVKKWISYNGKGAIL
tara:strand:+ start:280 stop:486 length:207 start_codon:yes stop_codon:yes gene_type:complete